MFTTYDISTSGLVAQRARLDAIASNLANISTTRNERNEPEVYRPKYVTFSTDPTKQTREGGIGVTVASVEASTEPPVMRYQPDHPDANPQTGMVAMPAVDMTTEFVDALEATRAYEANIGVMEITKDLGRQTLQIIV